VSQLYHTRCRTTFLLCAYSKVIECASLVFSVCIASSLLPCLLHDSLLAHPTYSYNSSMSGQSDVPRLRDQAKTLVDLLHATLAVCLCCSRGCHPG
jgi:hypothetical protein